MNFTEHSSNNLMLGAPKGWDYRKASCDVLPATMRDDPALGLTITSYWKPTLEELAELNTGGTVCLTIIGNSMPPVCLFTIPSEDN